MVFSKEFDIKKTLNIIKETKESIEYNYWIVRSKKKETLPLFLTGLVMVSTVTLLSPFLSSKMNLNGVVISYGMSYACGALFISLWDNYKNLYFLKSGLKALNFKKKINKKKYF